MTWPTDLMLALVPLVLLAWFVFDVIVAFFLPSRLGVPTLTHQVQSLSHDYPVIPFLTGLIGGLLAGHFWGNF